MIEEESSEGEYDFKYVWVTGISWQKGLITYDSTVVSQQLNISHVLVTGAEITMQVLV
jgi:hypothetical protein